MEVFEEEGDVRAGLGVPDQEELAAGGAGHAHIEHLDGRQFLQNDSGHEPDRMAAELLTHAVIKQ